MDNKYNDITQVTKEDLLALIEISEAKSKVLHDEFKQSLDLLSAAEQKVIDSSKELNDLVLDNILTQNNLKSGSMNYKSKGLLDDLSKLNISVDTHDTTIRVTQGKSLVSFSNYESLLRDPDNIIFDVLLSIKFINKGISLFGDSEFNKQFISVFYKILQNKTDLQALRAESDFKSAMFIDSLSDALAYRTLIENNIMRDAYNVGAIMVHHTGLSNVELLEGSDVKHPPIFLFTSLSSSGTTGHCTVTMKKEDEPLTTWDLTAYSNASVIFDNLFMMAMSYYYYGLT